MVSVDTGHTPAEQALNALSALGSAWRGDWNDFDGRTLRDQLDSWQALMRRALAGEMLEGEAEAWMRSEYICPVCRSWHEWCSEKAAHWPVSGEVER